MGFVNTKSCRRSSQRRDVEQLQRGVSTLESKSHLGGACSPRRFSAPSGSRPIMGAVEESSALVAIKLLSRAHRVCPAGTTAILTSGQDIHTGPIQSPRRALVSSFFALRASYVLCPPSPPPPPPPMCLFSLGYPTRVISHPEWMLANSRWRPARQR